MGRKLQVNLWLTFIVKPMFVLNLLLDLQKKCLYNGDCEITIERLQIQVLL